MEQKKECEKGGIESIIPAELKLFIASFLSNRDYSTAMQLSKNWKDLLKKDLLKRMKSHIESYPLMTFSGIHLYESSSKKEIITIIVDNRDFDKLRLLYDFNVRLKRELGNDSHLNSLLDRNGINVFFKKNSSLTNFGWTICFSPNKAKINDEKEIAFLRRIMTDFLRPFTYTNPSFAEINKNPFSFFAVNETDSIGISTSWVMSQDFMEKFLTQLEFYGFINKVLKIKILMLNAQKLGSDYKYEEELNIYIENLGNDKTDHYVDLKGSKEVRIEMREKLAAICTKANEGFNKIARALSQMFEEAISTPGFGDLSVIKELEEIYKDRELGSYQILRRVKKLLPRAVSGNFKTDLESFVNHYAKYLFYRDEYEGIPILKKSV